MDIYVDFENPPVPKPIQSCSDQLRRPFRGLHVCPPVKPEGAFFGCKQPF